MAAKGAFLTYYLDEMDKLRDEGTVKGDDLDGTWDIV